MTIDSQSNPKEGKPQDKVSEAPQQVGLQAPATETTQERRTRNYSPNHIFVGKKPVMSYAMSALIQLAQSGEIVVKARGMVISRAVDVAEIVTRRLGNNAYDVKNITIDTERVGVGEDSRNISTIEIVIGRK